MTYVLAFLILGSFVTALLAVRWISLSSDWCSLCEDELEVTESDISGILLTKSSENSVTLKLKTYHACTISLRNTLVLTTLFSVMMATHLILNL